MSAVPIEIRDAAKMLWRVDLQEEGEQLILETKILQPSGVYKLNVWWVKSYPNHLKINLRTLKCILMSS